ncbi:MAG: amidohydrolase family protein [Isosphaerales bacterium]
MPSLFRGTFVLFVMGSLAFSAQTHSAEVPRPVVIRGCSVLDVAAGVMRPGRTVVIAGGEIRAIGTSENPVKIPADAETIVAEGKFLIPGLIDAHFHLVHVLDFAHMTGDEVLPLFLAAGVTSVRDTGDEIVAETLLARIGEMSPQRSPRVFKCSPLIDSDPPFHRDIGRALTDPAKVPAFVDEMVNWKVTTLQPETLAARRGEMAKYRELTGRLYREGVMLLAGTDAPEPFVAPGFSLHQELEQLVESGLPPAEALRCATLHNAAALGQADRLGSIEVGKLADLILLDADPLANINNTRSIRKVLRGGIVLDPKEVLKMVPAE